MKDRSCPTITSATALSASHTGPFVSDNAFDAASPAAVVSASPPTTFATAAAGPTAAAASVLGLIGA